MLLAISPPSKAEVLNGREEYSISRKDLFSMPDDGMWATCAMWTVAFLSYISLEA